ncbi:hypothetical protein Enr8_32580 [Blastopirellula retiformator]|uniref:Uncharacterized protein n=1 Tax=Blastopirellula retiformator TaxID=2527970 RepID=A0A5C5V6J8_9BACT|nr:hypothetical protein Enr8_32580 [Blastopirellula retiformator]
MNAPPSNRSPVRLPPISKATPMHRRQILKWSLVMGMSGRLFAAVQPRGIDEADKILTKATTSGQVNSATLHVVRKGNTFTRAYGADTTADSMYLLGARTWQVLACRDGSQSNRIRRARSGARRPDRQDLGLEQSLLAQTWFAVGHDALFGARHGQIDAVESKRRRDQVARPWVRRWNYTWGRRMLGRNVWALWLDRDAGLGRSRH